MADGRFAQKVSATRDDNAASNPLFTEIIRGGAVNSAANPVYVQEVVGASSTEIQDYDTAAAVAGDGTSNHDYTVAGTTFLLREVKLAASGEMKVEIQVGPIASLVTKAVAFLSGKAGGYEAVRFDPPIEVPVTGTGTVRVIRTNREGAAQDLYTTILGDDLP